MTNYTLSLTNGGAGLHWGDIALRFGPSNGTGAQVSATGASQIQITTTQAHSAVAVMVLDWLPANGSSRVWLTVNGFTPTAGNGLEQVYATDTVDGYNTYVAYWPDMGPAGTYTVGLSAPTGMIATIVAVEILGHVGGASVALPTAGVTVAALPPTLPVIHPTGLVQEKDGSSATTSLTLTLNQAATVNNSLIVATAGYYSGAISSITLGGQGGLFKKVATSGGFNAEIWQCTQIPAAATSLVINTTVAGIVAYAYEVRGTVLPNYGASSVSMDKSAGNSAGSGTTWTSGATSTTISAQEFVVGLGMTVTGAANTITGPSSGGWTNETAHQAVVSGGFDVSAVSGYQIQASTGAAYTYNGTATTTTSSAAVAASFLLMPAQTDWGGVVFQEYQSYTGISATFTIPTLTGSAGSVASIWVGLGNVYQVGIFLTYDTTQTGNAATRPWSWWLPGAGENWNAKAFPTKAGDSLTLSMQLTSNAWLMTIANTTEGWSYTENKSVLAVNVGSIHNNGAGPATWPYPCGQAEVIVEREAPSSNPDYGSLNFTSITTTPAIINGPTYYLATANKSIDQYPGAFSGGAFTMHWNAPD